MDDRGYTAMDDRRAFIVEHQFVVHPAAVPWNTLEPAIERLLACAHFLDDGHYQVSIVVRPLVKEGPPLILTTPPRTKRRIREGGQNGSAGMDNAGISRGRVREGEGDRGGMRWPALPYEPYD